MNRATVACAVTLLVLAACSSSGSSSSSSGSSGVTCDNCSCCSYLVSGAPKHILCSNASDLSAACGHPDNTPSGCLPPQDGDCP